MFPCRRLTLILLNSDRLCSLDPKSLDMLLRPQETFDSKILALMLVARLPISGSPNFLFLAAPDDKALLAMMREKVREGGALPEEEVDKFCLVRGNVPAAKITFQVSLEYLGHWIIVKSFVNILLLS